MSNDDPLWLAIPSTDPLTATTHGEHRVEFVSRHAIAETGLTCPVCLTEVCPLGDYILVRHCRLGDVIKCNGKRVIQDEEVPCGMFLVASPDTEHGDHLLFDRTPQDQRDALFYRFVRITEGDAAKLKYGQDTHLSDGQMVADMKMFPNKQQLPVLGIKVNQLWQTDDERQFIILRVQNNGDPKFDGWGWGKFLHGPDFEWHVDPCGLIRQSMRDPTLNDRVRLKSEIRQL